MAASTKPICKYGSSCYRKNPQHLAQFSHEREVAPPTIPSATTDDNSLPLIRDSSIDDKDDTPPPPKRVKLDDMSPRQVTKEVAQSTNSSNEGEPANESNDARETIRKKFLVDMPEDFYQFWEFCRSINPSQPEAALESSLGLELVGPYHALGGRLRGVSWEKCVLHYRHYYDPPEMQTVVVRSGENTSGYHIGYFRDEPGSVDCLVVSSYTEKGCEMVIEGDSLFSMLRFQLTNALKEKGLSAIRKKELDELSIKLTSFTTKAGIPETLISTKDLWKQRQKKIVTNCFHKMGIVVPYDKNTEVGYRSLTMTDRELKRLLNRIASCSDEGKRDQFSEPLQEIVTYIQFANDECDYGMGLELGLDLFSHGHEHFHSLIRHLLPLAYSLLSREQFSKILTEHLKQRNRKPLDFSV